VSVFVIDCTTTGCADPTGTEPTKAVTVGLRGAKVTSKRVKAKMKSKGMPPCVAHERGVVSALASLIRPVHQGGVS
jgi:hypothetical protein